MKAVRIFAVVLLASIAFAAHAGTTSYFIYDESGHVIGEYDANGNPIQEHVYLGDRPVAVAVTNSGTTTVDYVTTDQLNTPRVITDSSQTVLWSWKSDPFGNGNPTGSLTYNLRFLGQYYDQETGHNYNHFRDYDSSTARYIESDPTGIRSAVNTFSYVSANPMSMIDFDGLCKVQALFYELGPGWYHAYVVTTDPSGNQTYFRGGPSSEGPSGGSSGALGSASGGASSGSSGSGSSGSSNSGNSSSPGMGRGGAGADNGPWGPINTMSGPYVPGSIDYQGGNPPGMTLEDDSCPCTDINAKLQAALRIIQDSQIPYNPFSTNSNATADYILIGAGFSPPSPPVWAPGWGTPLH